MSRTMPPPPPRSHSDNASPLSASPLAPVAMIPRSRARRDSRTVHSAPTTIHPTHANPSPAASGQSTPAQAAPSSTSISASTSASASSQPIATPSSPVEGTPIQSNTITNTPAPHPLQKVRAMGNSSSASVNGLVGLGMTNTGAGPVGGVMGTPQTGASKMAAAAKRGQAGGVVDGLPPVAVDGQEEDHPLSESALASRGYHTIHTLNRLFHLPKRWNLLRPLGQGAYGLVISVQDSLSSEPVAVKCITKVFDKVILARRALREITLLRHFGGHENLTGLIDLDYVWDGYNEIYLYMEPMEADLHQIIRSGQALSSSHIQYFLYQLLRGMKYIHSANVIHRDLKPGNLLVNADCELKICDFGLARGFKPVTGEEGQNEEMKLTESTRWYRAPEVMLSNRRYTTAIDVWSIGCILAELLGSKPIFKGKDYVDQLNLILGVLGTPDDATLNRVSSDKAAAYIRTLPHSERVPLQLILPEADSQGLDLLAQLLVFDPAARIDVPTALTHAFVGPYHDPMDEPVCPVLFSKWEEVESLQTLPELREAITREITQFREEVRTIPDLSDEEDLAEEEEDPAAVDMGLTASPMGAPGVGRFSPRSQSHHDVGVSPTSSSVPLPRQSDRGHSPLSARIPLTRESSRERSRSRDVRDVSPHTPATALSAVSEDSISAGPMTGRTSRRSSGMSMTFAPGRRPTSFLFSNPLGGGMTPMSTSVPLAGGVTGVPSGGATVSGLPTGGVGGDGWARPRSRAPSSTGEFASLRPLIRQLSTVGLDGLGKASASTLESGHPDAGADDGVPMRVSPSDAPPSEVPASFTTVKGTE